VVFFVLAALVGLVWMQGTWDDEDGSATSARQDSRMSERSTDTLTASTPSDEPAPTDRSVPTETPTGVAISAANAEQVVELARFGKGMIDDFAWSPDGDLLAVASSIGIWLYDAETLEEMRFIETDSEVRSVAFAPDGQTLASIPSLEDNTVRLWDVASGDLLHTLEGHTGSVSSVAFAPDGKALASGSGDDTVRLWDVASGELLHTLEGHTYMVNSVAFAPDGQTIATASYDDTVQLWDVENGELLHTLEGHTYMVNSVAFAPDGQTIASASDDHTVRLWDVASGELLHTLEGHTYMVNSVAFAPDGQTLASRGYSTFASGGDATVRLWDAENGELLHTLDGHTNGVRSVAFAPDGKALASGSGDDTVRLWDVASGDLLHTLDDHTRGVSSVAFAPDGETLASASNDETVRLWDAENGELLHTLEGHTDGVNSVALAPDGKTLVSGASYNTVRLWYMASGELLHTLEGHTGWVNSVAFAPDGKTLASASCADAGEMGCSLGEIKLWDAENGDLLRTLEGHTYEVNSVEVNSVAFAPDGKTLASASCSAANNEMGCSPGEIKLWDAENGDLLHTLDGQTSGVSSVAFAPDGETLASGLWDNTVRLWDATSGEPQYTLDDHTSGVSSVAFAPDGETLASGSWDNTVRLWDVASGDLLHTLDGHTDWVNSVALAPDGKTLASASSDDTVRLWDVASGELLHTLEGHTVSVNSVAFAPDGETLASASGDGTVRLWGVPSSEYSSTSALPSAGTSMPAATKTAVSTATPEPLIVEIIAGVTMEFVEVPAGPFLMGSSDADDLADDDEKPQHELELPTYWIGKTEVTNAQFRPFVEGDGYSNPEYWTDAGWQWREENDITSPGAWSEAKWSGEQHPVVSIRWYEAVAYARWLSTQTGREYRLPTEAEWEKAACGTDGRMYPWGNADPDDDLANFDQDLDQYECPTMPVGSYPDGASPYGALDMIGNVSEWCSTQWLKEYPYKLEDEWTESYLNPTESRISRVIRGGSWYYLSDCRKRWKFHQDMVGGYTNNGIRLLLSSPVPSESAE
jgi:WD40 repeat protein